MQRKVALGLAGAVLLVAALAMAASTGLGHEMGYLRRLGNGELAAVRCLPFVKRREVELAVQGLTLRGDLYGAPEARKPGIVLLHGSSVHGRRLPLYPALATELVRAGYHVLAIDLRGFGESEDPAVLADPAGWEFPADAATAVDSLIAWANVDASRIYLVGHSFGAGPAIAAAQRDRRISKVVMIGPTRRLTERFLRTGAADSAYYVERWQRDMRLPDRVPYETIVEILRDENVEQYADGPYETRVPVLLADGAQEDPRDLESLRGVAERMGPIATYWTTPGTDHYLHTAQMLREPHRWAPERLARIPCYNREVMRGFVAYVDDWLRARS